MEHARRNRAAAAGLVLALPALFLADSAIMQIGLGLEQFVQSLFVLPIVQAIVNPLVILGGLITGTAISILAVFKVRFEYFDGAIANTIVTNLRAANLATFILNGLPLILVLFYAFGENFKVVAR